MSRWSPQKDEPALTLAAIRWYGMSLEKLALDLYITDPTLYPAVKSVLSEALRELGKIRGECSHKKPPSNAVEGDEDGCAPGYVNCNGVCLPDCDRIAEY